ncbi:MAG TPA: type I-U CRISPR-associated protein Csb2, partial [Pirellulales bacterium]|nr:type I-U CRISPR-associated protein Csb2 [Pirellulales bacterium]
MLGIVLQFPAGRFHATPWGRHVNEGVAEWPPSPWRLLRSLVAVWKRKLDERVSDTDMKELLASLTLPPEFHLPNAATGHTRHYMPWFKKGPGDKTKVFDAFVVLERDAPVKLRWRDVYLSEPQRALLQVLVENLGWLGRAESWCEARLLDDVDAAMFEPNCSPLEDDANPRRQEPVRVLCADPGLAFGNEHTPKIIHTEGKGKNKMETRTPLYDPDWHLCMETLALHEQRWSDPPGSHWVTYGRESDCFKVGYARHVRSPRWTAQFQVARFAIDSTVLPLVQETLLIAEWARRGLQKTSTFYGKDAHGKPAKGHRHAYYLPTDEDGDGRLDHLTIVSETPFTPEELRSLDRLKIKPPV